MSIPERRPVYRLALARVLSGTGSQAASIALAAEVFRLTDSAVWLSATFFLTFGVNGLLSPVAGMIADRVDRRRLMVASDCLGVVAWALLLLARGPTMLVALGFLATIVSLPFGLSLRAALPNMVEEDSLTWANGLIATANNVSRLLGPAIGGAVVGVADAGTVFVLNALSFALSAGIVLTVRARFSQTEGRAGSTGPGEGLWSGFALALRDPVLRSLFVVWTILFLTVDIAIVADLPLAESFGWGAFGFGLMNAAFGGGALVGALASGRMSRAFEPWGVLIGALGVGLGYAIVAVAPLFTFVLLGQAVAAGLDALDEVAGTSIVQRASPDRLRGRVFGAFWTAGMVANTVGFTFAGFLVDALGPRGVYVAGAAGSCLTAPLLLPLFRRTRAAEVRVGTNAGTRV